MAEGSASFAIVGCLGLDLLGRLVLPQALESGLADVAVGGEAGELDLGDQLRLQPVHLAGLLRRVLAAERALGRLAQPSATA